MTPIPIPFHDKAVVVTNCGRLLPSPQEDQSQHQPGWPSRRRQRKLTAASGSLALCIMDLGYIDLEEKTWSPLKIPSG